VVVADPRPIPGPGERSAQVALATDTTTGLTTPTAARRSDPPQLAGDALGQLEPELPATDTRPSVKQQPDPFSGHVSA
jgi:hypothetical protein